jgi:hypothetical protein
VSYSHSNANKLGQRQTAHQVYERVLGYQLTDIKDRTAPRVLRVGKVEIIDESEDTGVAQTLLVEVLQEEHKAHLIH